MDCVSERIKCLPLIILLHLMNRILLVFFTFLTLFSCSKEEQIPAKISTPITYTNAEFYLSIPNQKSFFQKEYPRTPKIDLWILN